MFFTEVIESCITVMFCCEVLTEADMNSSDYLFRSLTFLPYYNKREVIKH